MSTKSMNLSCLCGAVSQQIQTRVMPGENIKLSIDHSDISRHATGILCVSYYPIRPVRQHESTGRTVEHHGLDQWTRYFCNTCGCHVLRSKDVDGVTKWEAATGVLLDSNPENAGEDARYARHTGVSDTKDGGLSVWLPDIDGQPMESPTKPDILEAETTEKLPPMPSICPKDSLPASCACGTVSFHITRPTSQSYLPHSGFSDLEYPAIRHSDAFMKNPDSLKWWVRSNGTKYLAGTCACRSCRLICGFEIQTWAFIPRCNIFFHVPGPVDGQSVTLPLDFSELPAGILKTYESSRGVSREFCGKCGATVFWRDSWRPDVIDVSAGLLRADEGARAETWLEWWTQRCSFEEETARGRSGEPARIARRLIDGLERGLRSGAQTK
ncbi:glutathione-dependent formaldehyde-activating enzyme [Colletotrichum orchidophilum]|uniref:Glutathione-dependent formaldehyde-activating enzyme n=1 Tax=Colletotrichum orchidophilum TaxID=1209926 RepID=A0A1G4BAC6_9PEZI|nr:glutathione-dependent formaldehyde-activating enzyme [Colletotrichum orchidophilum]OHE98256.1 glutathione-dependent formaldehyde-activating enzyme [Colletotrichum orchidophilum]